MNNIDDTSQLNNNIYEDTIKNNLYDLYLLINQKISNKNEINLTKSTIEDLISLLKTSIKSLLAIINNDNYSKSQKQLENNIIN